ncbi:hypothetical protein KKA85_14760 [bacterium]|nr:hypothetical protein [bacterium]MBU1677027.1 hypothetical protein [bacterium]
MRIILSMTVLLLAAGLAAAADPEVAVPLREGETPIATPAPALDLNRAELKAVEDGGLPEGEVVIFTREEAQAAAAARPVSPLMSEINAALDAERTRHTELEARFRAAPDERAALGIQREIEALARDTELLILQIQIDHARLAGREDVAQRIETAVAEMTAPRPPRQPQDRPAPVNH